MPFELVSIPYSLLKLGIYIIIPIPIPIRSSFIHISIQVLYIPITQFSCIPIQIGCLYVGEWRTALGAPNLGIKRVGMEHNLTGSDGTPLKSV